MPLVPCRPQIPLSWLPASRHSQEEAPEHGEMFVLNDTVETFWISCNSWMGEIAALLYSPVKLKVGTDPTRAWTRSHCKIFRAGTPPVGPDSEHHFSPGTERVAKFSEELSPPGKTLSGKVWP